MMNSSDDKVQVAVSSSPEDLKAILMKVIELKQNKLASSDDLPEGNKNLYYSDQRVFDYFGHDLVDLAARISRKQDILESTDDIHEGIMHQYFTKERAQKATIGSEINNDTVKCPNSLVIKQALDNKQDKFNSSDDISEGKLNKYLTQSRMNDITSEINSQMAKIIQVKVNGKQDKIVSSDDIPEGKVHQYHNPSSIEEMIQKALSPLLGQINLLRVDIDDLKKIKIPEPIQSIQLPSGKSGSVTFQVLTSGGKSSYQSIRFEDGLLKEISAVSNLK